MGLRSIILLSCAVLAFENTYAQDDAGPSAVNAPITTIYTPKGLMITIRRRLLSKESFRIRVTK
jgi:hypothetical protein